MSQPPARDDRATKRLEAMFARFTEGTRGEEEERQESAERINAEVHAVAESALPGIARVGMLSAGNSPVGRWLRGGALAMAANAAKRMRDAARLKALQRTPYPMVLARIKLLLDRLQHFKGPMAGGSSGIRRSKRFDSMMSRAAVSPSPSIGRTSIGPVARSSPSLSALPGPSASTRQRDLSPGGAESTDGEGDEANPDGDEGVCRLPLDKIMEELNTTYAYVSDFLRKVPEQTRVMSILWSNMENYKKDQDVYMTGDEPEKFYIILTGQVEVWTYPPGQHHHLHTHSIRERSVITTLKKGQSFGDQAILNNDCRSECVTPTSNCCFLTLERHAFLDIFGPYFNEKLKQAEEFFMKHVSMFQKVSNDEGMKVIRHMLLTSFKAGREWDPYSDAQIYFIKDGSCTLDAYDRKFVVREGALRMGMGDAPTMADTGPLAHVLIQGGRAVGTLGHEEEMRRLRRQLIPKKLMTRLGVGGLFGGGPTAMGDGEMQASLKVIADTDVDMYHMHIDLFIKHASPALMKALRDDISFKLTYYFGRNGTINDNTVVGHLDALLQVTVRTEDANPALTAALSSSVINPNNMRGRQMSTARAPAAASRKKRTMKAHEPGQYGPEVEKALRHLQELQEGFSNDPDMAKHLELLKSGVTPVQRFWSTPSVSNSARGNAISGLLASVFPDGLAPLGSKIDELIDRATRHAESSSTSPGAAGHPGHPASPGPRPYTAGDAAGQQERAGSPAAQRLERLLAVRQSCHAGSPGADSPARWLDADGGLAVGSPPSLATRMSSFRPAALSESAISGLPDLSPPGSKGSMTLYQRRTKNSPAALTAAGIMWERSQEVNTPHMRQCLTYDEMLNVRKLSVSEGAAGRAPGGKASSPHL